MNICVVGLGKLGAPMAAVFASRGHRVVGVDTDPSVVERLNRGRAPVVEPELQALIDGNRARLSATAHLSSAIAHCDISVVVVPTPRLADDTLNNEILIAVVRAIGAAVASLRAYHVVSIASTVMPGAMEGDIKRALEASSGKKVGHQVGLAYTPSFATLGNVVNTMRQPDLVLIGESDLRAGQQVAMMLERVVENAPRVIRTNWMNAETAKLATNSFVMANIAYAAMVVAICGRLPRVDVHAVYDAVAATDCIGSSLPNGRTVERDPERRRDDGALRALGEQLLFHVSVCDATETFQTRQLYRIMEKVRECAPPGGRIAILGTARRVGVIHAEGSHGVRLAWRLLHTGFRVTLHDPLALPSAMAALAYGTDAHPDVAVAVASADVIVVANPEPMYAQLPPAVFAGARRRVLIDCWKIFDPCRMQAVVDLHRLKA